MQMDLTPTGSLAARGPYWQRIQDQQAYIQHLRITGQEPTLAHKQRYGLLGRPRVGAARNADEP